MRTLKRCWVCGAVLWLVCSSAMADIADAIEATRPIVEARLRFENVDQEPFAEQADALTLRARLGVETGKVWGTALLAEGEFVWPLLDDYNSTTNGRVTYPTIPDPESYAMNRLQLVNTRLPQTVITLGRQRILLDDQRFVGNVGWRQNEQTFDALRVVNRSVAHLVLDVTYLDQVNRVFGEESSQGRYDSDSVLGNVAYRFSAGTLTAFGYWLEFDPIAGVPAAVRDSSATYGVRFNGERALGKAKIAYATTWATQRQHGDNPLTFDNDYLLIELTGSVGPWSLGVGLESLEGNGAKGFTTPLATLHKFQGWADKFLTTPADGIDDRYITAGFSLKKVGLLDALGAQASFHDYRAERLSRDYGSELNLQVQAKWQRFTGLVKYADYAADGLFTDTRKFWVQLEYVW